MKFFCFGQFLCVALSCFVPLSARAGLTYDLRVANDGKVAYVSAIGDVVNLELWAMVTGSGSGAEGFQEGFGSFLSSNGGDISGNLASSLVGPFNSTGSQTGRSQDLDGDLDLDLGSNSGTAADSSFFFARADAMRASGGVTIASGTEFKLANVTFTVTAIADPLTAPTTLNFRVTDFTSFTGIEALWQQDGTPFTSSAGSSALLPSVGEAVTIRAIPEPASGLYLALGALAGGSRRRRRSQA